ncbi:MAG: hypothetical protein JXR63_07450 [Spirochaetales bacterium]|nr:hypothetical protein [Spirochaetales bacterium]
MAEIKFELQEEIGVLSESPKGWQKLIAKVSWNDAPAKFDIRSWSPDRTKMSKGITLDDGELDKLKEILNK